MPEQSGPRSGRGFETTPGMPLKFFHIPSRDPALMEAELNAFLARHRVVTVERRFVECGLESFWGLCVDYLVGEPGGGVNHGAPGRAERKIDYKELLTPEQFEIFAKLRDLRKQLAEKEAVPVYAIFTNEQMAAMVQKNPNSRAELREIDGIGEAKVEKYAEPFLALLQTLKVN
jgi:superfamily II DNA helicase RecQ